jgi:hypothetical protein
VRQLLLLGVLVLWLCPIAGAERAAVRRVESAGVQVTIPADWHADTNKVLGCDPQRLMLVSSRRLRTARTGGLLAPTKSQVLIAVVEDHVNLPSGSLRRPARFSVDWNHPARLEGGSGCTGPDAPAEMHWFRTDGRYLGLTVYPGIDVPAATRTQTIAVMDSLRVTGRFTLP